jgi:hypothetical protein
VGKPFAQQGLHAIRAGVVVRLHEVIDVQSLANFICVQLRVGAQPRGVEGESLGEQRQPGGHHLLQVRDRCRHQTRA